MKPLVMVSADANVLPSQLLEWIVSLRTLGNYVGPIALLDYGVRPGVREEFKRLGATIVEIGRRPETWPAGRLKVSNQRYLDGIDIVESHWPDRTIASFDADIWFQGDINGLFDIAASCGLLVAPDRLGHVQQYMGRPADLEMRAHYEEIVTGMVRQHGATLNSGFVAGRVPRLTRYWRRMRDNLERGMILNRFAADQFVLNLDFDPAVDSDAGHLWNAIGSDCELANGVWYSRRSGAREKIHAQHITGLWRHERFRYFRHLHGAILDAECPHWRRHDPGWVTRLRRRTMRALAPIVGRTRSRFAPLKRRLVGP